MHNSSEEFTFPSLYTSTDEYSVKWQKRFLNAQRVQLISLISASIGGIITIKLSNFQIGPALVIFSLLCAIGSKIYFLVAAPERKWYNGRAAAESIKTLSWKYVQNAKPFDKANDSKQIEAEFLNRIDEILKLVPTLDEPAKAGSRQITKSMKDFRKKSLASRRITYMSARIDDQMAWYSKKSKYNEKRSSTWAIFIIGFELIAIFLAALRLSNTITIDFSGVIATLAAAAISWIQSRQYETLAQSYSVTSQELSKVGASLDAATTETQWASVVEQAEEAISREHTLWLASHR